MKITEVITEDIWQDVKQKFAAWTDPARKQAAKSAKQQQQINTMIMGKLVSQWNSWLSQLKSRGDLNLANADTFKQQLLLWTKDRYPSAFAPRVPATSEVNIAAVTPNNPKSVVDYLTQVSARAATTRANPPAPAPKPKIKPLPGETMAQAIARTRAAATS